MGEGDLLADLRDILRFLEEPTMVGDIRRRRDDNGDYGCGGSNLGGGPGARPITHQIS